MPFCSQSATICFQNAKEVQKDVVYLQPKRYALSAICKLL